MLSKLKAVLFSPELNFRARVFNMLALTGFLVSMSIFAISFIIGTSALNSAVLLSCAILSGVLLIYSVKSGNYYICCIITAIFIFMIIFPILFFTAGAFLSGMPCFFVFATTFTLFMLEGRIGIVLAVLEIFIYVASCMLALAYPEFVEWFPDSESIMMDVITGFSISSISLGTAMFVQLRLYNNQQKKLEEAMTEANQSNKAKGIFLANMSHEIRTPINVILGTNELINRSTDPEEIHEYTSVIQNSGDHLLSIINNILDVTQIESGKILTSSRPYRTDSLLSELSSIGSRLCSAKGLKFIPDISHETMSMLEGDKNHLRQIITNFISNAVKYTEHGSVTLSAETIDNHDSTALLRISVTDTGVGISEKEMKTLFENFHRGTKAIESAVEGTGLGLAISKDLADSLGGKLIVRSDENAGSTFGIELNQKIYDSSPIGDIQLTPDDKTCSDSFIAPNCHILAIDDNRENLTVIKMLLERTMITVDTALDGMTATDMVDKRDYDLIFLDYMMPDMDGIETLKALREKGLPESTPVIALTAEALAGSEEKFLAAGFTSYLSKPVSWHDLEKTLISLLPKDKVTINSVSEEIIPDEEVKSLSEKVRKYDINLESGISYLSGSITRFCSLAEIFADGYEKNHEKVRNLFDTDYTSLAFEVHSLKSASKGVGALNLFEQANELEKRLHDKDYEYAANAKELLLFEWKRAADGMNLLISALPQAKPEDLTENINSTTLEQQIKKGLDEHIWLETQNAIRQLSEIETNPEKIKQLNFIAEFVDELDFASAQTLFKQYRRKQ